MKWFYYVIIIAAFFSCNELHAQSYDKMWEKVKQLEKKDLPQTVIYEATKIYEKAKLENNTSQMIKAYLTVMEYKNDISPDSIKIDVEGIEQWAQKTDDYKEKAILYTILANITLSTNPMKGFEYVKSSIANAAELVKVNASSYKPIVIEGNGSKKYFRNNLLQLLAMSDIDALNNNMWASSSRWNQTENIASDINTISKFESYKINPVSECDMKAQIMTIYQKLLNIYNVENYRDSWIITAVNALEYLKSNYPENFTDDVCAVQLRTIINKYKQNVAIGAAYIQLAEILRMSNKNVECLKVIKEGMVNASDYPEINRLKNLEKDILNPSLSLSIADVFPGKASKATIRYNNLSSFECNIYRLDIPVTSPLLSNNSKIEEKLKRIGTLVSKETYMLNPVIDYISRDTSIQLKITDPGIYYMQIQGGGKVKSKGNCVIYATSIKPIMRALPDKRMEIVIADALSGRPLKDATLITYTNSNDVYSVVKRYQANDESTVILNDSDIVKGLYYNVVSPSDNSMKLSYLRTERYLNNEIVYKKEKVRIFTDRSIYRPGQTVYLSGVAFSQETDSTYVIASKEYEVQLFDVNNTLLSSVNVTTDKFGSFSGQFVLPSSCLNGMFRIKVISCNAYFRVEDYKRPTFSVDFSPINLQYNANDSIDITGTAATFSGVPLEEAKVSYIIERIPMWRWRATTLTWKGETVTDSKGKFIVPVRLQIGAEDKGNNNWYYIYNVTAYVTSGAGETQQNTVTIPLGRSSLIVNIDGIASNVMKQKNDTIVFSVTNLKNEPVNIPVDYSLYRMKEESQDSVLVVSNKQVSNKSFMIPGLDGMESGRYKLVISVKDEFGQECVTSQEFILFSKYDVRPPVNSTECFYSYGDKFNDEQVPEIYVGSSCKNVYMLYDVFSGNKRIESKRYELSDSIMKFTYPYKPEYGNGIMVSLAFVKDGILYSRYTRIIKPIPDKKLILKWITFRDKLQPGNKEQWRLRISYPDGKPAQAQLMATMYDASLNKLYPHKWSFYIDFARAVPSTDWTTLYPNYSSIYLSFPMNYLNVNSLMFDKLFLPNIGNVQYEGRAIYKLNSNVNVIRGFSAVQSKKIDVAYDEALPVAGIASANTMLNDEFSKSSITGNPRTNFAETAFFYPQLNTDINGYIDISFVLPQTLTKWSFMGFAHTDNVDYGFLNSEITASKDFMVQPNLPRFIRVGDKVSIASSIVNLTGKDIKGDVVMELFDPITEKVFYKDKADFRVDGGKTDVVSFNFNVPTEYSLIGCRIVADGGRFSDGEQKYIPILSNQQWITQSIPMNISSKGTYNFSTVSLFNGNSATAGQKKLTVEFSTNPIWYAIQALPAMVVPTAKDAYSWASSYYGAMLSEYIINANPRIKEILDAWKATSANSKDKFLSELQKNEYLKNIILSETPWVVEATNEADQRKRISTLFDLNTFNNNKITAVNNLMELQNADGSWSWYKGMYGSRYITVEIVELLSRLKSMTNMKFTPQMNAMYISAVDYLNKEIAQEYETILNDKNKDKLKNVAPELWVMKYLYICSIDTSLNVDRKINSYFIERIASNASELDIYKKTIAVIILKKTGNDAQAAQFLESVLQYSVYTKEKGRYFDNAKAHYSMNSYKIPVEVSAIEAIELMDKDNVALNEMKQWLLSQKQVQQWENPIATSNAVYALLYNSTLKFTPKNGVKIFVGSEVLQPNEGDMLGYLKKTFSNNVNSITDITVVKSSNGLSWGAIYGQCYEDINKVLPAGNELVIKKSMYKNGKLVEGTTQLVPGDIVTITLDISSAQDMDFVQIKDGLAACMEPESSLSGYKWDNSVGYYEEINDASVSFFIDKLRKGSFTIKYNVYITRKGEYQNGIAVIQSAYAPSFTGYSGGGEIIVK